MRSNLDLKMIFSARDIASAHLMLRKAECLYQAGLIDCAQRDALVAGLAGMIRTALPSSPSPVTSEDADPPIHDAVKAVD
jgi:hypothetical protein